MAKQTLRSLDLVALAVALDRAEEEGLTSQAPDPGQRPSECVYLRYVGPEQLGVICTRLPHATIQLRTMGGAGNNKKILPVFHRPAILHVLGFLFAEAGIQYTRSLDTVDRKYWKVLS